MHFARNSNFINGGNNLLTGIVGSKERKELQKLLKARDLPEYTTFAEKPEEEEIEDTSNLVELENMDSVIQEAIEKNIK